MYVSFFKKNVLRFLSLRYSADFRRSRLVDCYNENTIFRIFPKRLVWNLATQFIEKLTSFNESSLLRNIEAQLVFQGSSVLLVHSSGTSGSSKKGGDTNDTYFLSLFFHVQPQFG